MKITKITFMPICFVVVLISSICLTNVALAQGPSLAWAQGLGSSGDDYAHYVAVDDFNNVYTAGGFKGTIDFDFGPGSWIMTPSGTEDAFVTKSDASGNLIWAVQMGGNSETHAREVEIDEDGNVYVTGYLYETADFDPGDDVFNLTSQGERDIFVLKLDSEGGFIWAKNFGGIGTDIGYIVLPDSYGNFYLTGAFMSTVDFDPGITTYELTSNGHLDAFL